MREDLKNRAPVNSYIDSKLNDRLLELMSVTGYKKSQLLDIAIRNFLEEVDKTGEIPGIKIKAISK